MLVRTVLVIFTCGLVGFVVLPILTTWVAPVLTVTQEHRFALGVLGAVAMGMGACVGASIGYISKRLRSLSDAQMSSTPSFRTGLVRGGANHCDLQGSGEPDGKTRAGGATERGNVSRGR